jgi:hypothetical protein
VARCPTRAAGGEFLREDLDLDMAMSWGEQYAAEATTLTRKSASWRKREPSQEQINHAAQMGVPVGAAMTRGDLSDAISGAYAAARLDPMPCVRTVNEKSYW